MPRAKSTKTPDAPPPTEGAPDLAQAVCMFLHLLASGAEADERLARLLAPLVEASGLSLAALASATTTKTTRATTQPGAATGRARLTSTRATPPAFDPYGILRETGEQGLRSSLAALDVQQLRVIVRAYRLDPARISARWAASERLFDLIVEQVRARSNLGRAFERI